MNHTAHAVWCCWSSLCDSLLWFVQSRNESGKLGSPGLQFKLGNTINTLRYFKYSRFSGSIVMTTVLCCVSALCSSRFERPEGRPEGSDLRQGFLPLKIIQPLRLKARSSFLYPYVLVGCLNSNKWIIPVFRTIEVMHFDLRENHMSALNYERLAKIWNPGSVKPRTRNCKLQLMRFVLSHEKPYAKGLYQCCHVK